MVRPRLFQCDFTKPQRAVFAGLFLTRVFFGGCPSSRSTPESPRIRRPKDLSKMADMYCALLFKDHKVKLTAELPVEKLEVGMYVVQLDRPWLETPFLFQGFYIRDKDEIDELRAHCKRVHVSRESLPLTEPAPKPVPQTASTVSQPNKASTTRIVEKKPFSLRSLFGLSDSQPMESDEDDEDEFLQTNVFYKTKTSLGEETKAATGIHKEAIVCVESVMQNLKKSGSLDVGRLESTVTPMVDSVLRNPAALACLVRMQKKDDYLYHHSLASSVWATILGRQLGLSREDLDVIALGAMLLDVGKTQMPDEVLAKPGKLNESEKKLMRMHVQFGLDILEKSHTQDARVREMVAHHHERYNGTGYPAGLKGNDIPVFGRIAGIVDAYDAMITQRPYAEQQSSYDALRKLRVLSDVEFQAEIVDQFTRAIGAFPTGTLIELNTGEVAIVTRQNQIRRLRPEVMVIMGADRKLFEQFRVIDLNEETVSPEGGHSLWIERGLPPGEYGIDPTEFYLN